MKFIPLICIAIIVGIFLFFQQVKFGKFPEGERLIKIKNSPNFSNKEFVNQIPTVNMAQNSGYITMIKEVFNVFFIKNERTVPKEPIPSVKPDLLNLNQNDNILVWFGHSSYFIQTAGKKILIDPMFSTDASPIPFIVRAFTGSNTFTVEELYEAMPEIDYLFVTHDHWDHLDYPTIKALRGKTNKIICPLGVGSHLEYWGFASDQIVEADWYDRIDLGDNFISYVVPSRHFSGRDFFRSNRTLWASFVLYTPAVKLYFGGDSGYGPHFAEIGERFGPFDLAVLENGQYDVKWPMIHMFPSETLQAGKDLRAKRILPVHWGKFCISNHDWDDPIKQLSELANKTDIYLFTPMIGQIILLENNFSPVTVMSRWWDYID